MSEIHFSCPVPYIIVHKKKANLCFQPKLYHFLSFIASEKIDTWLQWFNMKENSTY